MLARTSQDKQARKVLCKTTVNIFTVVANVEVLANIFIYLFIYVLIYSRVCQSVTR